MANNEIIELQTKIAELELTAFRQSEEIYRLQQRCANMESQIQTVIEVVKNQNDGYGNEVPIDKPPHY